MHPIIANIRVGLPKKRLFKCNNVGVAAGEREMNEIDEINETAAAAAVDLARRLVSHGRERRPESFAP